MQGQRHLRKNRLSNPPLEITAVLLWRMDSMSGKRKAMRRNLCIYILSPEGPLDLQDYIVTGRLLKVDLYAHAQLSQPALIICWNPFITECRRSFLRIAGPNGLIRKTRMKRRY